MKNKITGCDITMLIIVLLIAIVVGIYLFPIVTTGRFSAMPKAGSIDCAKYPLDCLQSDDTANNQ